MINILVVDDHPIVRTGLRQILTAAPDMKIQDEAGSGEDALKLLRRRKYDLVIVADYGHGFMTPNLVDFLCRKAKFLAVNTQTNSANHGRHVITRYRRADFACLDDFEARLAVRDDVTPIRQIVACLKEKLSASSMAITLGHKGSLMLGSEEVTGDIPNTAWYLQENPVTVTSAFDLKLWSTLLRFALEFTF